MSVQKSERNGWGPVRKGLCQGVREWVGFEAAPRLKKQTWSEKKNLIYKLFDALGYIRVCWPQGRAQDFRRGGALTFSARKSRGKFCGTHI